MNRRQLLTGIAACALPKPPLGPGGPIYTIVPSSGAFDYVQLVRKTIELSGTAIQLRIRDAHRYREEPQPLQAWWEDTLVP